MEIIKLNLIPNGVNPTCHAKQYDEGRVIRFELFDGLTPYTLQSGDTVTLNLRKPDNTIIETSVTATQGNKYVDLVTTEQMCACVGYNLGTFKIANGSVVIGTLNFIMSIERDVLADGIPSQSVIEDLDALVQEAVGDNYYTKTETDNLLSEKANASAVNDINDRITEIYGYGDPFNLTWSVGFYAGNGSVNTSADNYRRTPLYPIPNGTIGIRVDGYSANTALSTVIFYNSDEPSTTTFVKAIRPTTNTEVLFVDIPDGALYVAFSCNKADFSGFSVEFGNESYISDIVSNIYDRIDDVFLGIQYPNTIGYSESWSDANNFPVNTIYKINNTQSTDIANLPAQLGTLIVLCPTPSINSNFETQIFITSTNNLYYRNKINSTWSAWIELTNQTPANFSDVFSVIPQSSVQKNIMLIGDSITQGMGSTGFVTYTKTIDGVNYSVRGNGPDYPSAPLDYQVGQFLYSSDTRIWYEALNGNGWAQKLKSYLESKFNCSVKNFGMSGINTGDVPNFLNSLVLSSNADIVFLMIGTNDRAARTLSSYYNNLKSIATQIKSAGKQLVIMAATPASVSNEENGRNFHMEDVEHVSFKVANEVNANFISLYDEFMNYCELKGVTIDSLLSDGLHPNDNGYDVIFNIITSKIGLNRKRVGATW